MKNAIKTSEESWIEQQMLEDKKRATDWEATNEAIEEQVARESYLQWLQDQEKLTRQVLYIYVNNIYVWFQIYMVHRRRYSEKCHCFCVHTLKINVTQCCLVNSVF